MRRELLFLFGGRHRGLRPMRIRDGVFHGGIYDGRIRPKPPNSGCNQKDENQYRCAAARGFHIHGVFYNVSNTHRTKLELSGIPIQRFHPIARKLFFQVLFTPVGLAHPPIRPAHQQAVCARQSRTTVSQHTNPPQRQNTLSDDSEVSPFVSPPAPAICASFIESACADDR